MVLNHDVCALNTTLLDVVTSSFLFPFCFKLHNLTMQASLTFSVIINKARFDLLVDSSMVQDWVVNDSQVVKKQSHTNSIYNRVVLVTMGESRVSVHGVQLTCRKIKGTELAIKQRKAYIRILVQWIITLNVKSCWQRLCLYMFELVRELHTN